mgnify:CR=1 FL=1
MRRLSMNISAIAAACAAALLAGCNLAPVYKTPDLPVPAAIGKTLRHGETGRFIC